LATFQEWINDTIHEIEPLAKKPEPVKEEPIKEESVNEKPV